MIILGRKCSADLSSRSIKMHHASASFHLHFDGHLLLALGFHTNDLTFDYQLGRRRDAVGEHSDGFFDLPRIPFAIEGDADFAALTRLDRVACPTSRYCAAAGRRNLGQTQWRFAGSCKTKRMIEGRTDGQCTKVNRATIKGDDRRVVIRSTS